MQVKDRDPGIEAPKFWGFFYTSEIKPLTSELHFFLPEQPISTVSPLPADILVMDLDSKGCLSEKAKGSTYIKC